MPPINLADIPVPIPVRCARSHIYFMEDDREDPGCPRCLRQKIANLEARRDAVYGLMAQAMEILRVKD